MATWWEFFSRNVTLKGDVRVLDFGSGTGPLLECLKDRKDVEAIGVEPSVQNAEFSRKRGHHVINAFLSDETFEVESFDVVHLSNSGQFTPDLVQVFRLFHKLLTPDGFLFWGEKQYHFSALRPGNVIRREELACYFSPSFLRNLLTLTGFEVVLYRDVFGEFKLIAQKTRNTSGAFCGRFSHELLILKTLRVTDVLFEALFKALLRLRPVATRTLKPIGRKMKLLP